MKQIVIAGGRGLVGRQVVEILARDAHVQALMRRHSDQLPDNVVQHVSPGETWPVTIAGLAPDVAISCLGTTMRIAGSQAAFKAVDHDLLLAFATAARKAGARHMIAMSSVGAMPASNSFYLRTKAEAEQGMRMIGFERLDIIRPGLLTGGDRADNRPGEALGIRLAPFIDRLMIGPFRKYASTPSASVARAIAALALVGGKGRFTYENDSIAALGG